MASMSEALKVVQGLLDEIKALREGKKAEETTIPEWMGIERKSPVFRSRKKEEEE